MAGWRPLPTAYRPLATCSGAAGDLADQSEEAPLRRGVGRPVDRDKLIAVLVVAAGAGTARARARVEEAPRSVPTDRREQVVRRLIEGEVVVLVHDDRDGAVTQADAGPLDHPGHHGRIG